VEGLREVGHEVEVFANFSKANIEPDPPYVRRVFHAPFLDGVYETDIKFGEDLLQYDIIQASFETSLYHPNWFPALIDIIRGKKPIIFTMHSSGIWQGFDTSNITFITHEPFAGWRSVVIPMGIKFYDDAPVENMKELVSFGLGRNNDDYVRDAIAGTDLGFRSTYGHRKWLPRNELVREIQKSWAVSLVYPPVGASVSSSAVNLAIGCGRPIFASNTNWFNHVRHLPAIYTVEWENPASMRDLLQDVFDPSNYENIINDLKERKDYIIAEGRDYNTWIQRHCDLYKNLV
jgi:hypothetical protein